MDLRLAWQGPALGGVEGEAAPPELTVEAGFLKTLPVSLTVSDPELPQEVSSYRRPEEDVWGARLAFLKERTMSFMIILMITVGAFLMLRNLHQRRGDRPRAARLAWFVVLTMTLRWFLLTSWTSNFFYDFWRFAEVFGFHLFYGGACGVLYLGLEPYIRRVWPHMLIGWTRILSGRWRDPMVGRDVIVGVTAGLLITLIEPLGALFATAIGSPPPVSFMVDKTPLEGITASVADILKYIKLTVLLTLVVFLMLSLLQSAVRSRVVALGLFLIIGLLGMPAAGTFGGPLVDNAIGLLKISIWLFFALRFGVLTTALMQFVHMITGSWPLTIQFSAWYGTPTIILALVLGPLAVLAARTACRGASRAEVRHRAG
jgi:serine/threonine-protein kinase